MMTTYTMPVATHKQLRKAERLQARLYNEYNTVNVEPQGITHVRITATN